MITGQKSLHIPEQTKYIMFLQILMQLHPRLSDCLDLLNAGKTKSGVYSIQPGETSVTVQCDMETDNGGWTVNMYLFIKTSAKKQPGFLNKT